MLLFLLKLNNRFSSFRILSKLSENLSINNCFLDDNISMKNNGILTGNYIFFMVLILLIIIVGFFALVANIVLTIRIKDNDIKIKLNIRLLLNLIDINRQLYPPKQTKKIKKRGGKKRHFNKKLRAEDIQEIYRFIRKIEVYDLYSDIEFGNSNVGFTSFIYVFINFIYGNIISIINPRKIYLNVLPDFTKDYLVANIKVHIRPKIRNLILVFIVIKKINKNNKEVANNEGNRFNTKAYGDNS